MLVAWNVFAQCNRAVENIGLLPESVFDFTQFDAKAAKLHLSVGAAEKLDYPVFAPPRQITSPVKPRIRFGAERVVDKFFRGKLRAFPVTTRQPIAAEKQFTRGTDRHRLELSVQNVSRGIRDRLADWDRITGVRVGRNRMATSERRAFGRTITIDEAGSR